MSDDYPQGAMPGPGTAVTIGAYDGVHLGHRALLADLQTIADAAKQLLPIEQPKEDLWDRIELAIKRDEDTVQPD